MSAVQTIVVIGTGYVGLPAALMWARAGQRVIGVDIDENVVRAINERTMLLNERRLGALLDDETVRRNLTGQTEVAPGDVFVIAVPTPVDPLRKVADLTQVRQAIESICPVLQAGNLVIIESTVPPTTCRAIIKPLIEASTGLRVPEDVALAHCPERILPGNVFEEIVHNDRLIGGLDTASTERATATYATFVKGALLPTTEVAAELAKLMENTYRDVNIALANEFAGICDALAVDAGEAIGLANRHPRVDILSPGIGVGGHCIPVDPWFLKEVAPRHSSLIAAARRINDDMPGRVAARIRHAVHDIESPRIVALGASYKRDCEDARDSPALEIVEHLRRDGYRVDHLDPLIPGMHYASLEDRLRDADLCVVLVAHQSICDDLGACEARLASIMRTARIERFDHR